MRSLIDGVAAIATAQIGDLVSPQSLLTTVSQVDPIRAYFSLSEQEYLAVADQINQPAAREVALEDRRRADADARRRQPSIRGRARSSPPIGRSIRDRHDPHQRVVPESEADCCAPGSTDASAPKRRC